jgi:DNA replication protein DnaC
MRAFDAACIPGRYHEATLANFEMRKGSGPARIAAHAYAESYLPGQENRGLVLHGAVGRGKTHLMIGLLRELILRYGVTARFVEFTHLLADLKVSFERGGAADLLEPLSQVQVLAIDELGKGRNTAFEGTVLDELVSRRYNAAATILATTNYEPGAATHRAVPNIAEPEQGAPALIDRVGDRVHSRLREMCDFVPVRGEDFRELSRPRAPRPRQA